MADRTALDEIAGERRITATEADLRAGAVRIVEFMRRASKSRGSFIMTDTGQISFEDYAADYLVNELARRQADREAQEATDAP